MRGRLPLELRRQRRNDNPMKEIHFSIYPGRSFEYKSFRESMVSTPASDPAVTIKYLPRRITGKAQDATLSLDFALLMVNEVAVATAAHFATSYVLKILRKHKEKVDAIKIGSTLVPLNRDAVAKAFLEEIEKLE